MRKLTLLLAMLAVVMLAAAVPAVAQNDREASRAAKSEAKAKEMPKSGGAPIDTTILGLGAGVLLIGGGFLIRRVNQ